MIENVNGETNLVGEALVRLRSRMDELLSLAESICSRHLEFIKVENRNRGWEEKSILFVKPRLRDNTLSATWYIVNWYGSKAMSTRRMVKKVIVKPKHKHGYTMETLSKQSRSWEIGVVTEVEGELIPIRREATFLGGAISKLNQIRVGDK